MKPVQPDTLTDLSQGLSDLEAAGAASNQLDSNPQTPLGRMIFEEFFSFFNIINYILAGVVLYTGSYKNLMFMLVVLSNTCVGLYQKIHSRRILSRLALLHAQKYEVIRSKKTILLPREDIVEGDILRLQAGAQIPCDGIIRQGSVQVNESILTGESDPQQKEQGDSLYGGCFVISGSCIMQAVRVGTSQYMASILSDARKERRTPSQLRDVLDALIRFCSWFIFPAGILLFLKVYVIGRTPLNPALLNAAAAMIGMIPEGLVILTSAALMSAAVKMARQNVLVHELYCIENLAHADILCLDKTGTITSGSMTVRELVPARGETQKSMRQDLADLFGSLEDDNLTAQALRRFIGKEPASRKARQIFPFSSAWKSSGATFEKESLLIGAYTFLFAHPDPAVMEQINGYAAKGLRVLALARSKPIESLQKGDYTLCGLILIEDEIRPDAAEILDYFKTQHVTLKVISGDMTETVAAIAARAGIHGKTADMSLVADDQIPVVVDECSIFGRVSPEQKKLMIQALQQQGHTVAMTGDGVNDVMALKQADCSIAMGSGAQAAMAVASLVLLDDQFSALPQILAEGRRVINNIQRTASLFLVKTLFSFFLTLMTVLWMKEYPFVPIQLTLVSSVGIGIPSFILTFENDTSRPKGDFLVSVLSRALPGALAVSLGISLLYLGLSVQQLHPALSQYQSACTVLTALNALGVLFLVCRPFSGLRLGVFILSCAAMILALWLAGPLFSIEPLEQPLIWDTLGAAVLQCAMLILFWRLPWSRLLIHLPIAKKHPVS